jgi:iron complex transport system ATP-binding protein
LRFARGGVTVLIGPNGCGKSTLIKTAAGLLRPVSGEVLIEDKPLTAHTPKELARRIAYLPQSRQLPAITAERMVLHGRFPYLGYPRRYRAEDYEAAQRALESVGAAGLRQREMTALSGGERQKVYLAMALAQDTPAVLMDEPTTYLDIDRQLEVMRLATLLRRQGKAVVMVLHDLNLAFRFADTLHLMREGQLVCSGTPEQLSGSGALEEVFHVRAHRVELPGSGAQYVFD